jgi:hypothetical protein
MRSGLGVLFVGLAVALTAANSARASSEEIPLESGTYARVFDWCKVNRADQNSPVYKEKRAYINLSPTEINWDESVGKITNVSVDGNKVTLGVEMTEAGSTKPVTLPLTRKNKKLFVLIGVNFYHCSTYQPNPRLGR